MEGFIALAKERGMTVQVLDKNNILIGYQGRWEIMPCDHRDQEAFYHVWHMFCNAHWVEPYLPDGLVMYAKEMYSNKEIYRQGDLAIIWEAWMLDKSYYSKFKYLLGADFDLFVDPAMGE